MVANGFDDDQTRSFTNLAAGTIVSHYKIISKIGAGGMGEVYLAEDTQLDRNVALKFLPPHLSQDDAARARFTREAKAAAKLDHPNIVQVFEVGEFQGRPFFAMAHVEGKSLRDVIRVGKLSINETIEFTKQICEGLHEAHSAGVIHRDIKPGNIIIDSNGKARILDFGLATVAGEDKLTKTGSTLGTVGYMSPEQIEGKQVDHRSDLFSVGVILYEMLTGRRPFEGDTDAAVARSITDNTPEPIARYKSGTTGELQQIIDKALTKDPVLRYQHADGMAADLMRLKIGIPLTRQKRSRALTWLTILISLIILTATYLLISFERDNQVSQVRRRQITFDGDVYTGSLSPDGKYLAYVRGIYDGIAKPATADSMHLYVLELDAGEPIRVFSDWWIAGVWWTPDGRELLIRGDNEDRGGFYLMPKWGGSPRYYPIGGLGMYWRVSWSPDGNRFAAASDSEPETIFVVDKRTGQLLSTKVEGNFNWIWQLSWSPAVDKLLLVVHGDDGFSMYSVPVMGGQMTEIRSEVLTAASWAPDGKSIRYIRPHGELWDLMSIDIDAMTIEPKGEPTLLVADIASTEQVGLDTDASKLCFVRRTRWSNIGIVDLDNNSLVVSSIRKLTSGTSTYYNPVLSPDGKSVVCTKVIDGVSQIVIVDVESGEMRQISHTGGANFGGAWSPDGSRLAYATYKNDAARLAIVNVKGGVPVVFDSCVIIHNTESPPISWAPDTKILYVTSGSKTIKSFDPEEETWHLVGPADSAGWKFIPIGSPTDELFAFYWVRHSRNIKAGDRPLPDQTGTWISSPGGENARSISKMSMPIGWSSDGEWVYTWRFNDRYLARISIKTGAVDSLGTFPNAPRAGVSISPDAARLTYVMWESTTDLWLVENIPEP